MKVNGSSANFFKKNGYILFNNLLNKKELETISKRLEYLEKSKGWKRPERTRNR